jgi:EpsI family protein
MPELPPSFAFLRGRIAQLVTFVLLVEIALFYRMPTAEYVPHPPPLNSFQRTVADWTTVQELELDSETQALLKADDTISRAYVGPSGHLSFFVAFFKSQRGGVTPHSPKICLPGAGWTPQGSSVISIDVPGEKKPLPINRYIVRHGEDRSLVLYWYSTAHHVMADEYVSKLYLMDEGLRYRRSDEAVYRVIVPIRKGEEARAEADAVHFVQASYAPLKLQMWMD